MAAPPVMSTRCITASMAPIRTDIRITSPSITSTAARPIIPITRGITGGEPSPSGMKDGGKWIQGAHIEKGALHRQLKVPEGEPIPAKKLEKAAHSTNPTLRKRAALARTLEGFHH